MTFLKTWRSLYNVTLMLGLIALTGCQTTTETHYVANPDGPPPPLPINKIYDEPMLGDVLFELDSAELGENADAQMRNVVYWLMKYPQDSVTVVGHGCDLGSARYNYKLGEERAEVVAAALVAKGIPAARVTTASRGETAPVVPNDSEHRARNRRVRFELHRTN